MSDDVWLHLLEAARDSLLAGRHDGSCTNEGTYDDGPCEEHLKAARVRERRLTEAIRAADEMRRSS